MTTILPADKNLRNAIAWIEEHRAKADLRSCLDQAAARFNLSPKEELALARFYEDKKS